MEGSDRLGSSSSVSGLLFGTQRTKLGSVNRPGTRRKSHGKCQQGFGLSGSRCGAEPSRAHTGVALELRCAWHHAPSSSITRAAQRNLSVPTCAPTNTQALASHGALDPARALPTVAGAHQPEASRPMITVAATHMHSKLVDSTGWPRRASKGETVLRMNPYATAGPRHLSLTGAG